MQKILVVDDDKNMCFLLNLFLSRKGYEVTVTYSGQEALQYLEEVKPDLILSDLRLEDIDGITLLGKVKEKYADLPVIIITGHSDIKISAFVLKQGAFDYVVKPLVTEQILLTIHEALNNRKDGQTNSANIHTHDKQNEEYFFWGNTNSFKTFHKTIRGVTPQSYAIIKNYAWHDNIRELKNMIKKAVLLNSDTCIWIESLPPEIIVNADRILADLHKEEHPS